MSCDYYCNDDKYINNDFNILQVSVLCTSDCSKSHIPVTYISCVFYYALLRFLSQIKLMATVHQTQPMIQLLLSTPDYVAALDLISTTQEILVQELAGVHSFR
jgi:hypothetical protein